ncbi:uncharacterized protein [Ptychodera flava]|uniref:uncharacterized protein n=1 Tax=Ptychodera flava TaxID=63121 RepID=UPI00396A2733
MNRRLEVQKFMYGNQRTRCHVKGELRKFEGVRRDESMEEETVIDRLIAEVDVRPREFAEIDVSPREFKAVQAENGIVNIGAFLSYTTPIGESYGKLVKCIKTFTQDICIVQKLQPCQPRRFDKFNCEVFKLTEHLESFESCNINCLHSFIHCCEYTTCRMKKINGQEKYVHEEQYHYYRINRFFIYSSKI